MGGTPLARSRSRASWTGRICGVLENTIELKSLTVCRRSAPTTSAEALAIFEREVLAHLPRSEEHTSELQSRPHLVCRLLLEKKKKKKKVLLLQDHPKTVYIN